jgi:STE24 endopeptidase
MSKDEILFVMGHEIATTLHHIWQGLAWVALGSFAVLWLTAWITGAMLGRFGGRWGVTSAGDLAAMPLLFAMLALVNYVGAPIGNAISRGIEHEADVFSLELTHDNDAGARSFLKLAAGNRSNPEPAGWVKLFCSTTRRSATASGSRSSTGRGRTVSLTRRFTRSERRVERGAFQRGRCCHHSANIASA